MECPQFDSIFFLFKTLKRSFRNCTIFSYLEYSSLLRRCRILKGVQIIEIYFPVGILQGNIEKEYWRRILKGDIEGEFEGGANHWDILSSLQWELSLLQKEKVVCHSQWRRGRFWISKSPKKSTKKCWKRRKSCILKGVQVILSTGESPVGV